MNKPGDSIYQATQNTQFFDHGQDINGSIRASLHAVNMQTGTLNLKKGAADYYHQ
jgi:hypothetical protein